MPSYNHGRFIRQAIDSVLSQDYPSVELIVMDGGSGDRTVDILRSYGSRLSFVSARDRGQSDAINRGLERSEGDIVCWLNSDDFFLPGAVSTAVRAFEDDPGAGFVYGRGWNVDEQGRHDCDSGVMPFDLWRLIHQRNFIHQPSCFFRRSALAGAGLLDQALHFVMDWDLWIRLSTHRARYVDAYLSCNRTYAQNKTQSGQFRRWFEIRRMVRRYTSERWPPVLTLYLLEAVLQTIRRRRLVRRLQGPIRRAFERGMALEMNGRRADGGVERQFRFSVAAQPQHTAVRIILRRPGATEGPDHSAPMTVRWAASSGGGGALALIAGAASQSFVLPLGPARDAFVHFRCAVEGGRAPRGEEAGSAPVAFLDRIAVE
jgi:glycosyltransferase involved in cell wall biosynthesis